MLKSLELFGFKSFADRTVFEFSPGISCVVGPNGSGKSNVVDAIKWILGDQSAKSLRGSEMLDVIFNGSSGRRPSGFAEASLTFDNSQGLLPSEASEVQIGRRLYRSGDSEYLLNGNVVRLKDVRDLFMGTGAGTAAYSIIEQGRVDQILQANPATRRFVFEEASGISKFKARRIEAERRLERVGQNLVRLTDLVDQLEAQLNATRSQASKAARFRELSAELKRAWTGLAADQVRRIRRDQSELHTELASRAAELQTVEAERAQLESAKRAAEEQLAACEDAFLKCEREVAGLRERMSAEESTIRHESRRSGELEEELRRVRGQSLAFKRQSDFAVDEVRELSGQLVQLESQIEHSRRELQERELELDLSSSSAAERRQWLHQRREELSAIAARHQQLAARMAALNGDVQSVRQKLEDLEQRRRQLSSQRAATVENVRLAAEERERAESAVANWEGEFSRVDAERLRLHQELQQAQEQERTLHERRASTVGRLAVLDELEQRQEGIAIGPREILRRAQSHRTEPWSSIVGLVRDLLDVPLELAPIIDAALAERSQLIAVRELGPMLDYLRRGNPPIDGRVGFVSLHAVHAGEAESASQDQEPAKLTGVYGRADQLIQESSRASGLAQRVLGDTWVVESLEVARRVIQHGPAGVRAVTLQGELLQADGQLFVGALAHESSIVSRKSELRQLRNEIHQLDRGLHDLGQRLQILERERRTRADRGESLSGELRSLRQAAAQQQTRHSTLESEVSRLDAELAELETQLAASSAQLAGWEVERETLAESSAELESEQRSLQAEVAQAESQLAEIDELLRDTRQQIQVRQVELAASDDRIRSLRQTQNRLERDQRARSQQWEESRRRIGEVRQTRRRLQFEVLRAEGQIAELALRLGHAQQASAAARTERDQMRTSRGQYLAAEEQLHQRRRELSDRTHALEFEIQKLDHQQRTFAERIQEEYQLDLDELIEHGASAYEDFLVERYGNNVLAAADAAAATSAGDAAEPPVAGRFDSALVPPFEEVREELEARVDRLRRKLKSIGHVNTEALEHLDELETRFTTLTGQLEDLRQAKSALEDIIRRINHESRRMFTETFEVIRGHFRELFRKLFGGGDADIVLENPEDVLECGIDIVARPPGKELRSISLLSGGEKTMTAVGLLFAMFKSKPSPYCILDEVDAALDEANVDRYVSVLREFVSMTQFVVITHRKRTMTAANVLYGVTMEQAGVSKKISVRFEDVRDNGEIRRAA